MKSTRTKISWCPLGILQRFRNHPKTWMILLSSPSTAQTRHVISNASSTSLNWFIGVYVSVTCGSCGLRNVLFLPRQLSPISLSSKLTYPLIYFWFCVRALNCIIFALCLFYMSGRTRQVYGSKPHSLIFSPRGKPENTEKTLTVRLRPINLNL